MQSSALYSGRFTAVSNSSVYSHQHSAVVGSQPLVTAQCTVISTRFTAGGAGRDRPASVEDRRGVRNRYPVALKMTGKRCSAAGRACQPGAPVTGSGPAGQAGRRRGLDGRCSSGPWSAFHRCSM